MSKINNNFNMSQDKDILLEISRIKTIMGIVFENKDNRILFENNIPGKLLTPAIEFLSRKMGITGAEMASNGFVSGLEKNLKGKSLSGLEDELDELSLAIKRGATSSEIGAIADKFLLKPLNLHTFLEAIKSVHPARFTIIVNNTIENFLSHSIYTGVKEELIVIYRKYGTEGLMDALNELKKQGKVLLTDSNEFLWKNWHPGAVTKYKTPKPLVTIIKNYVDGLSKTWIGGKQSPGAGDAAVTVIRIIKRSFTPITKLRQEFFDVAAAAEEKLLKFPPEPIDFEMKKMADIMGAMNKKGGDKINYELLFKDPVDGLYTALPKKVKETIEKNKAWKEAYDILVNLTSNLTIEGNTINRGFSYNITTLDWRAMKEILFVGSQKGFKNKLIASLSRTTNIIASVEPLSWKESREALIHRGTKMNSFYLIVGKGLVHAVVMPAFFAFIITDFEMLISKLEYVNSTMRETYKKYGTLPSWWLEFNFVDYNEGEKTAYFSDLYERFKDYIPTLWWAPFINYTYMDDVFMKMIRLTQNKGKDDTEKITKEQSCIELMNQIKNDKTGAFKLLGCDASKDCEFNRNAIKKGISLEQKENDPKPPEPTPTPVNNIIPGSYEAFKQFCASQNPPLTPDADPDGKNNGIYTVGGVEYEWDGTTFIK